MTETKELLNILHNIKDVQVLCIGDVMLDRYVYGVVERISPDAPVPVLRVEREDFVPGGAGGTIANLAAIGAQTTALAVTGDDHGRTDLENDFKTRGVTPVLIADPSRPTIVKKRLIGAGQHIVREDHENTDPISTEIENMLLKKAAEIILTMDAVVLSDYKKGTLTDRVIAEVITLAQKNNKPVIVDSKKSDLKKFQGAQMITPNRSELEAATGMTCNNNDDIRAAAMRVIVDCGIDAVLATRSEEGMSLITKSDAPLHLPAQASNVKSVAGGGDTVIAVFATALAAGATLSQAALLSNIAAGIAVAKPGTSVVTPEEIKEKLMSAPQNNYNTTNKIVAKEEAAAKAEEWRAAGLKVGFTNGTFDLLHPGHVSSIQQARGNCDKLIVAVNSDASVKRYKGEDRPIQGEQARATILSALGVVDLVVIFEEDTPMNLLEAIRPDVLVKGGQYKLEEVVGYELIQSYGGKIVRADMEDGFSTTNTVEKMAS